MARATDICEHGKMEAACNHCSASLEVRREPQTPYQRIVQASAQGRGIRLSAEDVRKMAHDSAISNLAELDDLELERGRREDDF